MDSDRGAVMDRAGYLNFAYHETAMGIFTPRYSKASISRMIEYLRVDIDQWLKRSLETYYPVVFIR